MAEPHRGRVDQLLRPVLLTALDPLLKRVNVYLEALGWEEVQTAADPQALQQVVDRLLSRQPGLFAHWRLARSYQG